ncbi:MAG: hypothetical protein ACRENL_09470, partial [Candidatus Dormibacteria bacterium]
MPGGPRRPVVQQWPGDADSLAALWREFREFRGGLLGTDDFPLGELPQIKAAIAAAERHRAEDVQRLHSRLDA